MGTRSHCNVTSEMETTIQYISEDKILINNSKNETLHSDCGPNNRALTGNFLISFWNCTITFNNKKFHSYEIRSEMQIIQGALHNVQATRKLISTLDINEINQENIKNRKQIEHVYLKQVNHQTWIWTLSGGISISSMCIIILIIYVGLHRHGARITVKHSSSPSPEKSDTEPIPRCSDLLRKYGIKPKTEDALSPPPGGVTFSC